MIVLLLYLAAAFVFLLGVFNTVLWPGHPNLDLGLFLVTLGLALSAYSGPRPWVKD
jgi:hypothetical protein